VTEGWAESRATTGVLVGLSEDAAVAMEEECGFRRKCGCPPCDHGHRNEESLCGVAAGVDLLSRACGLWFSRSARPVLKRSVSSQPRMA